MEEKIDVLMATYNGEKFVANQIESILNQTYKNINLIISDDCSNDRTRGILKEYEEKDSRVKVYYQENNLGYIKNFEFLLKQVQSNYYALSDQDDIWTPEKIEVSYNTLKQKKVDMVFGDLEVVDKDLKTRYESFGDFMLLNRKIEKCKNSYKMNYLYNCVTGCTILAKKETLEYILPIPNESKRVAHDHWIALMVSLNGKLAYIKEKYIKYRQHGDNQIGTDKISHKFKKLQQVRELFIEVKLGVFGIYVKNNNRFPEHLQKLNEKALKYYEMLNTKKYFNFKGWNVFYELYKEETFIYFIENFMILNFPAITTVIFNIRYVILKLLGKR